MTPAGLPAPAIHHTEPSDNAILVVVLDRSMETPWSPCACSRRQNPGRQRGPRLRTRRRPHRRTRDPVDMLKTYTGAMRYPKTQGEASCGGPAGENPWRPTYAAVVEELPEQYAPCRPKYAEVRREEAVSRFR